MKKLICQFLIAVVLALVLVICNTHAQTNVKVVNTTAQPVPVANVDQQGFTPFQANESFSQNGANVSVIDIFTVPAGKRLVLEYISMAAQVPANQRITSFKISTVIAPFQVVDHNFVIETQPLFTNGDAMFRTNQLVKLYAGSGSTVKAILVRNSSINSAQCEVTISGYLVDAF